jgi:WD40 repeat protein
LVQSLDWFSSEITNISISSDGSVFSASWMLNSAIQRWAVSNAPGPVQEFENAGSPFSVSTDGIWLAAESANGMAQIIETSSGKVLASFPAAPSPVSGPTPRITALVLSSDKRLLASLSSDWKIRLWDVGSGQLQREIAPQEFAASGLELSPDGRYLAANGAGNNLAVWDTSSGEVVRYFDRGGGEIAFHPNGVQVASVREDGKIELLDLRTGTPTWVTNKFEVILSLAFSPDGRLLAVLNNDSIQFQDVNSGEVIEELPIASARSLAFSPDGKTLAIGCADGTIRLFRIK